MPFDSVEDLKQSPLFQRMPSLAQLSAARLRAFVQVFNRVFARLTRNGVAADEADAKAIPFAISAARNFTPLPAGRTAESREHFFAVFAPDMDHGASLDSGQSTDLTFPDAGIISDMVAGQPFNHRHDRTDPVGVIRRVIATADAPAEVQAETDPDVPFLIVASFFDDVPSDERFDTVSGEWGELRMADGSTLALPSTFAVTPTPANGKELGIGMVANTEEDRLRVVDNGDSITVPPGVAAAANRHKESTPLPSPGTQMPDETPANESVDLESKVAELGSRLEEEVEARKSAEANLDAITGRLAALSGNADPEDSSNFDAEASIKALAAEKNAVSERLKEAEARIEEMRVAGLQAEGEAFLKEEGLAKGRLTADAVELWVEDYVSDAEKTKKRLASIPEGNHIGAGGHEAAASLENLEAEAEKAVMADIDAALGLNGGDN